MADPGLFGPDSATWRLHSDPLMGVAGLRALLLQALHPVAMQVVDDHSSYRSHAWQRLATTGEYVSTTTFGTTEQALAAGAKVRSIHARISGVDKTTGLLYRADDEDLLLWIHCALLDSILDVIGRSTTLADGTADRYVAEQVRAAELVGLERDVVPASAGDLADYLVEVRPQLAVTRAAREAATYIVAPPMRPLVALATPAVPAWAGLAGVAFAALPAWARRLYALPELPGSAPLTDVATTLALRSLRAAFIGAGRVVPALRGPSPAARRAHVQARTQARAQQAQAQARTTGGGAPSHLSEAVTITA